MDKMKIIGKKLLLSVLAGVAISLGGLLFLVLKEYTNEVLASYSFSIGLLIILCYKYLLFTGKIGYIFDKKYSFVDYLVMFIGNLIGAVIMGYIFRLIGFGGVKETNEAISLNKLQNFNVWKLLLSGVFCGMFVYMAVDLFQIKRIHLGIRILLVILLIGTFVILKLNHCIANMFYFSFGNMWSGKTILFILINTLGNSVGAIILNFLKKLILKFMKKDNNQTKTQNNSCN